MTWIELEKSRSTHGIVHVIWRCTGCRALAVTGGNSPGKCGKGCGK